VLSDDFFPALPNKGRGKEKVGSSLKGAKINKEKKEGETAGAVFKDNLKPVLEERKNRRNDLLLTTLCQGNKGERNKVGHRRIRTYYELTWGRKDACPPHP